MTKLKLITFDLDDTLWDIKPTMTAADKTTRDFLTTKISNAPEWYNHEGMAPIRDELLTKSPELIHDLGKLRLKSLEIAISRQGFDPDFTKKVAAKTYEVFFNARQKVHFFKDALQVLATLKQHFMLGVITNGNADVTHIGISEYFKFALTSSDVGVGKPHPDIFLRALNEAGVNAGEALHVGDHPENDLLGAEKVGMSTLYFRQRPKDHLIPDGWQPTLTADNMRQMKAKIMDFAADRQP